MPDPAPSHADVEAAAARLAGVIHRTPIATSRTLDRRVGAQVLLKCENLQRTGSFKIRGAYNALSLHRERAPQTGVVTFSSGNHAQAMSLSSSLLGVATVVVMPADAPAVKLEATRGYGAEVVVYDRQETTREEVAATLARERGLTVIPAYDHRDVIAGQGTAVRELIEDAGPLDLLLVCLGGGGLLSGSALSARALSPACRVVGVEPARADDGARSFHTGTLHRVHNPPTIADGARTPCLGELTFPLIRELVDDVVTVSEEAIVEAMRFLWERVKLVVEPTGALALAALTSGVVAPTPGSRVGVTLTGGNVDLATAAELFAR
jgi:threonine dehydratase